MKKGPERDLFSWGRMDYFQVPITDAALPVIPAEGAAAQLTGLTVKSPVNVMVSVAVAKSLPNFCVVSVIVHVSSAVPAANARFATSGVGSVKVGF